MEHSPLPPRTAEQEAITELERAWPAWQIWTVHQVVGGTIWCARRWDGQGDVLNAHTQAELTEYLTEVSR